jgi:branched-chain amino acid aminotransferase
MPAKIYLNGKIYDQGDENARVSVYDHGLLYGDGVFEGIRAYNGKAFLLEEHIDRLFASAKAILLPMPVSRNEMAKAVDDTVAAAGGECNYIRVVVTRGSGTLGLNPFKCSEPQVVVIADKIELYPKKVYDQGLEIVTVSTVRNHPAALSPRIKSLNYLNNILAKIEGIQAGCLEALMLNHKGEVAECTGDNVFLVRDGRILTPPCEAGILEGITRDVVIGLARNLGFDVEEAPLTKHDVYIAHECFLTGTAAEVVPVVKLDSRPIGDGVPGPVTRRLMERFHELTRS